MQAGTLRHRVTIQALSAQRDDHGGIVETWVPVLSVWASVEPLRSQEIFRAQQVDARLTHRVTMRYQAGLTSAMRLVHNHRVLLIISIANPDERNRMVEILAMEDA